jgi:glutaredoxin
MYGGEHCEDTQRSRARLKVLGIEFHDLLIDDDPDLQRLVRTLNNGYTSTPTIIVGGGNRKLVLTEPTDEELDHALAEYGIMLP